MSIQDIKQYFVICRDVPSATDSKEGPFYSRSDAETWARGDSKRLGGAFKKYFLQDNGVVGALKIDEQTS
jgi:hypothetical protein